MRFLRRIFFILLVSVTVILVGAQVTLSFLMKTILEREGRHFLQVPIYIERAGVNLFGGDVWMKGVRIKNVPGFQEPDLLTARTIALDFSVLSFLTNEFGVNRILFKDPELTIEGNEGGQWNFTGLANRMLNRLGRLLEGKPRLVRMVTHYLLEKFAVRNGTLRLIHPTKPEMNWTLKSVSFSLARILYPPDPEEALPAAVYLSATVPGEPEGKILILGRLNPFGAKKSFDITGSAKGLSLKPYSSLFNEFPLVFAEGTLQLKVKALCHDDQVDIVNQVRVEHLKFQPKESADPNAVLAFGLPAETVVHFFNDLKPPAEPFEFEFRVTGDFGDPEFDLVQAVEGSIRQTVHDRVTAAMEVIEGKAKEVAAPS